MKELEEKYLKRIKTDFPEDDKLLIDIRDLIVEVKREQQKEIEGLKAANDRMKLREEFEKESKESFSDVDTPINGLHLNYIEWLEKRVEKQQKEIEEWKDKFNKLFKTKAEDLEKNFAVNVQTNYRNLWIKEKSLKP